MANLNVSISLEGFDGLFEKMKNSPQVIEEVSKQMITKATYIARGTAQENSPIDKGILRNSITSKIEGNGRDIVGIVGTNISYAKFQEIGTRAHGPVRARFLAWKGRDKKWIFAKFVRGITGRKFMEKGMLEVKNRVTLIQELGLSVIKARLGG